MRSLLALRPVAPEPVAHDGDAAVAGWTADSVEAPCPSAPTTEAARQLPLFPPHELEGGPSASVGPRRAHLARLKALLAGLDPLRPPADPGAPRPAPPDPAPRGATWADSFFDV